MFDLLCHSHHPIGQKIVHYTRRFKCPNDGTEWIDTWCCNCNDRCPTCDAEIEPLEIVHQEVFAA